MTSYDIFVINIIVVVVVVGHTRPAFSSLAKPIDYICNRPENVGIFSTFLFSRLQQQENSTQISIFYFQMHCNQPLPKCFVLLIVLFCTSECMYMIHVIYYVSDVIITIDLESKKNSLFYFGFH